MLREAKNVVRIEGILSEINLKYGSYVKNGTTVDNIGGSIKVLVNQDINGEKTPLIIPVYMFSQKYTKKGEVNPAYESIEKVMKEYVSIASGAGVEGADKIRISAGQLRMNEYPNKKGEIVSHPRVYCSFVNKAVGEFRPEATWELEFAVSSMDYATDKDGVEIEPKELKIKVLVPQYGGKVDAMELIAKNPVAIDAISQYWERGNTYTAKGRLNFTSTTEETIVENDFGEPDVTVRTITKTELVVTKGTQSALDEDFAFNQAELAEGLKERKARLEEMKTKKTPTKATPSPNTSNGPIDLGF